VHAWSGQCNKNLGNAFVIVWRIGDETSILASQQNTRLRGNNNADRNGSAKNTPTGAGAAAAGSRKIKRMNSMGSVASNNSDEGTSTKKERKNAVIDLRRVPGVDILANHALIGYCKIIAEINRNKYVLRYRNEPRLTERGQHDFKVRMGFGLHAGWAIEGAVGSLQKVDATYLSPHVNMAARLETSSKQYGVPLLASQDFYDLLSPEGQSVMRRLDVVTVKGSEVPTGIYTYDALQEQEFREDTKGKGQRPSLNAFVEENHPMVSGMSARHSRIIPGFASSGDVDKEGGSGTGTPARRPSISLLPGDRAAATFLTSEDHVADVYEQDYDLLTLRKHATDPEFLTMFKEGVALYLAGDWQGAKVLLSKSDLWMRECVPVLGGDGPSQTLLNYMENQNFEAPKKWAGFRPLTAK